MGYMDFPKRAGSRLPLKLIVVGFMGLIALAAHLTGMAVVLFPELAALSHDVLLRPDGEWASQPAQLILAPTITAAFGLFCTHHMPYSVWSILLIVIVSLIVIRLLRCSMSPAISAGVLPLLLNEHSWLYPVAILFDLSLLALILLLRKRYAPVTSGQSVHKTRHSQILNELEAAPRSRFWSVALLSFVFVVGAAAQFTGLRFILFPPLIVMGYELLGHPEVPGWMKRPALLPFVCLITAGIGLIAEHMLHPGFLAVMITMLCSIGVLRLFDLHMPPALAIGILPFVIESPNYRYALSVFLGTVVLTLSYRGYKRVATRRAQHSS
jgi:hypothetical protein